MNIKVEKDIVTIVIKDAGDGLEIVQDIQTLAVNEPKELILARRFFSIFPLNVEYLERCSLPLDKIGG